MNEWIQPAKLKSKRLQTNMHKRDIFWKVHTGCYIPVAVISRFSQKICQKGKLSLTKPSIYRGASCMFDIFSYLFIPHYTKRRTIPHFNKFGLFCQFKFELVN